MKRLIAILLVLAMVLPLIACSSNNDQSNNASTAASSTNNDQSNNASTAAISTNQTDSSNPQQETKPTLDEEVLNEKLRRMFIQSNVAGLAVAVTDGEKIIYSNAYGVDNVEQPDVPADPEALYRIASVSKTFTGIMIMRLYEEGILDLDTPIKTYIPTLKLSKPEAEDTMTLRHLLTHTAGMPADDYMYAGSRDEIRMNEIILEEVAKLKLSSLPGEEKYQYSTWGYNLIGCVASVVTNKPLSQLISEYVLDPLGMTATTFFYEVASTNPNYPLSLPHVRTSDGLSVDDLLINTAFNAGAGLYSNTTDMCILARFFLNRGVTDSGERLLSEKLFDEMCKIQVKSGTGGYGFGVSSRKFGDRYLRGHTGTYYGQNYCCSFYVDEKTGYGIMTLMNTRSKDTNTRFLIPETIFGMVSN